MSGFSLCKETQAHFHVDQFPSGHPTPDPLLVFLLCLKQKRLMLCPSSCLSLLGLFPAQEAAAWCECGGTLLACLPLLLGSARETSAGPPLMTHLAVSFPAPPAAGAARPLWRSMRQAEASLRWRCVSHSRG